MISELQSIAKFAIPGTQPIVNVLLLRWNGWHSVHIWGVRSPSTHRGAGCWDKKKRHGTKKKRKRDKISKRLSGHNKQMHSEKNTNGTKKTWTRGPEGWGPEGWGAKISRFFSLSHHNFLSLFLFLCVFSWNFGGV